MRMQSTAFIDGRCIEALMKSAQWRLQSVCNDDHKTVEDIMEIVSGAQAILEIASEILLRGNFEENKPSIFKQREAQITEHDNEFTEKRKAQDLLDEDVNSQIMKRKLSLNAQYGKFGGGASGAIMCCAHGILKILGCSECPKETVEPERCPHGFIRDLSKLAKQREITNDDLCAQCVGNRP